MYKSVKMNAFICLAFILFATTYAEITYNRMLQSSVDLVMSQASITASSTCGMKGPERYCEMVHHSIENEPLCKVCDNRNPDQRHPIEYAKSEDDNKWWQSSSLAEGQQNEFVNVTIDLKQVYQIVYMILKMGHSPRPANWILEKSIDGVKYEPWIFFAQGPLDCLKIMKMFGMAVKMTNSERPPTLEDNEVYCTTYYSEAGILMKSGEIILSLVNGRKSFENVANSNTKSVPTEFINFLSARYIRMRFLKIMTLGGEFMSLPGYRETSIYNRYFYSLKNIEIGGKCICNNHAVTCDKYIDGNLRLAKCQCQHNTCGNNCERCCPMFNQKPWSSGGVCEECQCNNKADSCVYNQTIATLQLSMNKLGQMDGGGVCKGCKMNTEGINCEKCVRGYYRPSFMSAKQAYPCRKCNCHPYRSYGTCVTNGDEIENQKPGDCHCKPNYKPPDCKECALGYKRRNSEICDKCPCNLDGSVESPALYRCEQPCNCKMNVDPNSLCNRCKPGHFNLDKKNPAGCQPCFCFGITSQCNSLNASTIRSPDFRYFKDVLYDLSNWKVTQLVSTRETTLDPKTSELKYPYIEDSVADKGLNSPPTYYFQAPSTYLGNWLTSFKTLMLFVVKIDVDKDNRGSQIDSPDVYLECNKKRLFYKVTKNDERLHRKVMVRLEQFYWKQENSFMPPTFSNFMSCLVNVERFLIKAKYYSNQKQISLLNVTLDRANPMNVINGKMPFIEKCQCPKGYSGLSCETCAPGYRRYQNQLVRGICMKCDCNNHSMQCDAYTGKCSNCQHNTTGHWCHQCKRGFYGSPQSGKPNSCTKCRCPRLDYQMTDQCTQLNGSNYECKNCANNTEGRLCERCTKGYFGDPMKKVSCKRCQCNNNEENCDSVTGACNCKVLFEGAKCETCVSGYWGNPLNSTKCSACECNKIGSVSSICDPKSGQCYCKENFIGRNCDQCKMGMYKQNDKCIPCPCSSKGVKIDYLTGLPMCNSETGACLCKTGFNSSNNSTNCDVCQANYFGFPNCQDCRCSNKSKNAQCDQSTGSCECGSNVLDIKCNKCIENYFWSNKTDCTPCKCGEGALSKTCDMMTGNCKCAANVIGPECNQCATGYYGLTKSGCKKCQICGPGKICNSKTGACECPPNTEGSQCQNCKSNTWGYDSVKGCKECQCSLKGSNSETCDLNNGKCHCKATYAGDKCDQCTRGFYNYPNCTKCACNDSGVVDGFIDKCDTVTGQCKCKENVEGSNCDMCKPGTFGLNKAYVAGCFGCFCSSQKRNCTQVSGLRLVPTQAMRYNIKNSNVGVKLNTNYEAIVLTNTLSNVSWPTKSYSPLYADLTNFLPSSDLTTFYGSDLLSYTLSCDNKFKNCVHNSNELQTVFLLESFNGLYEVGYRMNLTNQLKKDYIRVNIPIGVNSKKGEWVLTKSDNRTLVKPVRFDNVTLLPYNSWRDLMMTVLINVTRVRIQLYTKDASPDMIKFNLFLNEITSLDIPYGKPIQSVENCTCDSVAGGLNCQNPTKGFYREIKTNKTVNFTVIVDLQPPTVSIEPCKCNGHSKTCNEKTGVCFNCTGFTRGPNCEVCALGYFGDASKGPCSPCACPSITNNNALTCVLDKKVQFKCLCSDGYQGNLCDKCAPTFYRNPNTTEVNCLSCNCNKQGSLSQKCNEVTGKCECATGITGHKCDQCSQDYVLYNKTCKDCRKGCTTRLFKYLDKLNKTLGKLELNSEIELLMEKINKTQEDSQKKLEILKLHEELKANMTEKKEERAKDKAEFVKKMEELEKNRLEISNANARINETIALVNKGNNSKEISTGAIKNLTDLARQINKTIEEIENMKNGSKIYEEVTSKADCVRYLSNMTKIVSKMDDNLPEMILKSLEQQQRAEKIFNDSVKILEEYKNIKNYSIILKATNVILKKQKEKLKELEDLKKEVDEAKEKLKKKAEEIKQRIDKAKNALLDLLRQVESMKKTKCKDKFEQFISKDLKEKIKDKIEEVKDFLNKYKNESIIVDKVIKGNETFEKIIEVVKTIKTNLNLINISLSNSLPSDFNKTLSDLYIRWVKIPSFDINTVLELKKKYNELVKKDKEINDAMKNMKPPGDGKELKDMQKNLLLTQGKNNVDIDIISKQIKTLKQYSSSPNVSVDWTDVKLGLENLKGRPEQIEKQLNETMEKLKKIREKIKNQRHVFELSHGSASMTPEPVRFANNCIRKYTMYFLPTSYDFDFKLFLKPEYLVKSMILFGYDDSVKPIHTFAVVLTDEGKLIFMWHTGDKRIQELSYQGKLSTKDYSHFKIFSKFGKWQLMGEIPKLSRETVVDDRWINDNIRVSSKTTVFVGGLPSSEFLNNDEVKSDNLFKKLSREYTATYQGCATQFELQSQKFGLSDIYSSQNCVYKPTMGDFTFLRKFSCKVLPKKLTRLVNYGKYPVSKNENLLYHFGGYGYLKIIPALHPECTRAIKNSLKLIVQPYRKSSDTIFVMVYYHENKDIGMVIAEKDGTFQVGYWIKDEITQFKTVKGKTTATHFQWILNVNVQILDGVGELINGFKRFDVCDKSVYFYLGNVPETDKILYEKVKRFPIDKMSFSGGLAFTNMKNMDTLDNSMTGTRLIDFTKIDRNAQNKLPVNYLYVTPAMKNSISMNQINKNDGFISTMIQLKGNLTTRPENLLVIKFNNKEFKLQISSEYVSLIGTTILNKPYKTQKYHYIRLKFGPRITVMMDNKIIGEIFPRKTDTVELVKLFALSIPYYIYSSKVYGTKINFISPEVVVPRDGDSVLFHMPPSSLLPLPNYLNVDIQSENTKQLRPSEKEYSDLKNSALFSASSTRFGTLTQDRIEKYWKSKGVNELSIRIKTHQESQAKLILDVIFKNYVSLSFIKPADESTLLIILRKNGKQIWADEIPVSINYENWSSIKIYGQPNKKEFSIDIDKAKFTVFDVVELSLPTVIQIGGYSGPEWSYKQTKDKLLRDEKVGYFNGCMDIFTINGQAVNLLDSFPKSNPTRQCPRVFNFISNGGHILSKYTKATQPKDAIYLTMSNMERKDESKYEVGFKIQFTGYEKGVLIMTGDDKSFCYLELDHIIDNKGKRETRLYLKLKSKANPKIRSVYLPIEEGWLNIDLELYFYPIFALDQIKFKINGADSDRLNLAGVYSKEFIPEFYFGFKPDVISILSQKEIETRQNFVGCISNIQCRYNSEKLKSCAMDPSHTFIWKGVCTVDKQTYLMKMKMK